MTKETTETAQNLHSIPDLSQYDFPEDYTPFSDENLDMLP